MRKIKSTLTILGAALASGATVITTNQVVEQYNYNNIHEITTNDIYYIDGEEVSEEEFNNFKIEYEDTISCNRDINVSNLVSMSSEEYTRFLKTPGMSLDYLLVYSGGSGNTDHACICFTHAAQSNVFNSEIAEYKNDYHELGYLHPEYESTLTCARRNDDNEYSGYCSSYMKSSLSTHKSDIAEEGYIILKNARCEIINSDTHTTFCGSGGLPCDLVPDNRYKDPSQHYPIIPQYIISFEKYNTFERIALGEDWR